jgi:hypothetical protein
MQGAIICADYAPVDPSGFIFSNNTLINNKVYGIYMLSEATTQNQFVNNIIVGTAEAGYQYVKLNSPNVKWTESNNIKTTDLSSVKFVNTAAKDWHLQTVSTAKDAGKDMRSYGVTKDLDDLARPQGAALDIGAFEIKATGTANQAPVANAGADKTVTLPATTITLTGSGTDADGTIASYTWTKISGGAATLANATTASLSLSALVAGSYTFRLTVKDNAGASATDDVVVTVNIATTTGNKPPVANAGADQTITLPTNTLNIAGSATDSDGIVMYWEWTKVSGGAATLTDVGKSTVKLSALAAGTYVFRLKVTDNLGAVATDDVTVTVKAAASAPATNAIPTVNAGADQTIALPTTTLNITGSASDSDGTVMYWEWTKVSGGTATLTDAGKATLKLSALTAGTYVFRLKVTDNLGAWKADDMTVTVKAATSATARVAATAEYTPAAETGAADSTDVSYAQQTSEEEFVIMDKHFPAGHQYAIVVFDTDGTRVYAGAWSADRFNEIFQPGKMYIYHVIQDGVRIDIGRVVNGK